MLKRKIHNHLIEWKNRGDKKALIITGARQVGKTTAIREFAKENYTHFVFPKFTRFHPIPYFFVIVGGAQLSNAFKSGRYMRMKRWKALLPVGNQ